MSNLQDFFQQSDGTDGGQLFKGNAITLGTSAGAKSVVFSNDQGEIHLVGNPLTGTVSFNVPTSGGTALLSGQAIQGLGVSTGGNTVGSTGTTVGTVVLAGGNNVTLSQSTAAGSLATVTISAANSGTVISGIGVSTGGNSAGNTGTTVGTVVFAGAGGVTLSQATAVGSLATITISGGAGAAAVTAIGVSTGGNTSGNTGTTQGTYILAGGNNITLSQSTDAGSSATVTISGPNMFAAGVSTDGNTAGSTGTVSSQIEFVGLGNVTLSQSTGGASNATITISGGPAFRSWTTPVDPAFTFGSSNGGFSLVPIQIPYIISATKMMFLAHMSGASGSTGAVTWSVGVYTLSGSTASLASSASRQLSWTSGTATTVSTNYGGNSGTQYRTLSLGTWNITPGEYLFGFYGLSTNAGTWTYFGGSTNSIANAQDTNQTNFWLAGFSTSSFTTGFPASINITNTQYVRTGASAMRQPTFFLQGTG